MRRLLIPILTALALLFVSSTTAFSQSSQVTATVKPNPLKVEVFVPGSVTVGEWFEIDAAVTNKGDERIRRVRATISPVVGLTIIRGSSKKSAGNLRPTETRTVSWRARLDSPGGKVVLVEAVGILSGEEISASDTALISTTTTLALLWRRLFLGS